MALWSRFESHLAQEPIRIWIQYWIVQVSEVLNELVNQLINQFIKSINQLINHSIKSRKKNFKTFFQVRKKQNISKSDEPLPLPLWVCVCSIFWLRKGKPLWVCLCVFTILVKKGKGLESGWNTVHLQNQGDHKSRNQGCSRYFQATRRVPLMNP